MVWSKINSVKATTIGNTATTTGVNTAGATLIVGAFTWYTGGADATFTDSKSNTWTFTSVLTEGIAKCQMAYCINPSTDSSHTFSAGNPTSQFPDVFVIIFSDTGTSRALDVGKISTNTQGTTATSIQPGSLTSTAINGVFVTGLYSGGGTVPGVDSSFNLEQAYAYAPGVSFGGGIAWKENLATATENPTWSWSANVQNESSATQLIFLASGVGSGSLKRLSNLDGLGAGGPFFSNPLGG